MATDIVDKELKEERNARWDTVFRESAHQAGDTDQLKASIVQGIYKPRAISMRLLLGWAMVRAPR